MLLARERNKAAMPKYVLPKVFTRSSSDKFVLTALATAAIFARVMESVASIRATEKQSTGRDLFHTIYVLHRTIESLIMVYICSSAPLLGHDTEEGLR